MFSLVPNYDLMRVKTESADLIPRSKSRGQIQLVLDVIRGNGYLGAPELCPQFEKNLNACFLITLEQSNKKFDVLKQNVI